MTAMKNDLLGRDRGFSAVLGSKEGRKTVRTPVLSKCREEIVKQSKHLLLFRHNFVFDLAYTSLVE